MTNAPIVIKDPLGSRDNEVRPYQIEGMNVKGRAVRLGTVAEQVLHSHNYPDPVAAILGEMLALAALLGSIIKFEGVLTLQAKSKGAVPLMVADYELRPDKPARMRGYARIDETILAQYGKNPSFKALMCKQGFLVITIDQGADMERYQGIVEMDGDSLSDVARSYFKNSEQLPSEIRLNAARDAVSGFWRAGGIMAQHLARGEEGQSRNLDDESAESWNRASTLMGSVKTGELLDPALTLDELLYRLFQEDGVRVYDAAHVEMGCRCNCERIRAVIAGFPKDDIEHMTEDGSINVTCEFCSNTYKFDPADFLK